MQEWFLNIVVLFAISFAKNVSRQTLKYVLLSWGIVLKSSAEAGRSPWVESRMSCFNDLGGVALC